MRIVKTKDDSYRMNKRILLVISILATIVLMLSPLNQGAVLAKHQFNSDLLKQILKEQKLQTALNQDNANVSTTRLNTMLLYMQKHVSTFRDHICCAGETLE